MYALKLCPFCGGSALRAHEEGVRGHFHVLCMSCGASAPSTAKWNTRAEPEQPLADMLRTRCDLFQDDKEGYAGVWGMS